MMNALKKDGRGRKMIEHVEHGDNEEIPMRNTVENEEEQIKMMNVMKNVKHDKPGENGASVNMVKNLVCHYKNVDM